MLNVNTYDYTGYSSEFIVSGKVDIPLPGGGRIIVGGGESDQPQPQYPYYPVTTPSGLASVGIGTLLLIGLIFILLMKL